MFDVIIVGAGYVGLTLGIIAAESGHKVCLVETDDSRLETIKQGKSHFYELDINSRISDLIKRGTLSAYKSLPQALTACHGQKDIPRIFIITLGTPFSDSEDKSFASIASVVREVAEIVREWDLVILRSTVKIGTTRRLTSEFKSIKNIAFCPERTVEGEALKELRELPQIIGYSSVQAKIFAEKFFLSFCPSVIFVSNHETAEAVKLISNTFRDLNFAFANAIALLGKEHKFSGIEAINAANKSYSRTNVPIPGPVGGPCLEKDPLILCSSSTNRDIFQFVKMARTLNRELVTKVLLDWMKQVRTEFIFDTVIICGLAFKGKPLTNDTRGSLTTDVVSFFNNMRHDSKRVIGIDPLVKKLEGLEEIYTHPSHIPNLGPCIVIICTNHAMFYDKSFAQFLMQVKSPILSYWEFPKIDVELHRLSYSLSEGSSRDIIETEVARQN